MRKIIRLICFCLIFTVLTSVMTACSCSENQTETPNENVRNEKHYTTLTQTDIAFITNGTTEYKILISDTASAVEQQAASEFTYLFKESTGITLQTVLDTGVSYSEDAKYLSLGQNDFFVTSGLTIDGYGLGDSGVYVKTKGKSIFMTGAMEYGTLYSVYQFFQDVFGFEQYTVDYYKIDKNVTSMTLPDIETVEIPDFQYRAMLYSSINATTAQTRMRMREKNDIFAKFNNRVSNHNALQLIPKDTYNNENNPDTYHPKWYSVDGTQLCYYARGDEAEREALKDELVKIIIQIFDDNPTMEYYHMGHSDSTTWCDCTTCADSLEHYNANSASVLKMMNDIQKDLREHYKESGRVTNLTFFAYYATNDAPVAYDAETDTYSAIDGLRCEDGVYVYWADTKVNYQRPMSDTTNKVFADSLRGWSSICDKVFLWSYNTNFTDFLAPFESINYMQSFYQFAKQNNVYYFYDQGQNQSGGSTGFSTLKIYLISKLLWNTDLDKQALIKDFFTNVYAGCADTMYTLYNELTMHLMYIDETKNYGGSNSVFRVAMNEKFWPLATLERFVSLTDKALSEIEPYKMDENLYERLYKQIILERISFNYLRIGLYETTMTNSNLLALKKQTWADIERIGMTSNREGHDIIEIYNSWGL